MMKIGEIIAIIIIVLILSLIIFLIVFFSIRENKYNNFVKNNSKALKDLKEINEQYVFEKCPPKKVFHHRFDNKKYWYKTEPAAYLSREIRNHLEYWFDIKKKVEYNNETFNSYKEDVKRIDVSISKQLCEENKKSHKKCLKIERKLFDRTILMPTLTYIVVVKLQYVSPKGQVNVSKEQVFKPIEINRILDSVSVKRVSKETYEKLALAERAILSDSMRYDVMKRDGFRCVLCGMSAQDGAILHVDHIIPVSKGGKSVMSNLRTLCEKCNIGKSNKIE